MRHRGRLPSTIDDVESTTARPAPAGGTLVHGTYDLTDCTIRNGQRRRLRPDRHQALLRERVRRRAGLDRSL